MPSQYFQDFFEKNNHSCIQCMGKDLVLQKSECCQFQWTGWLHLLKKSMSPCWRYSIILAARWKPKWQCLPWDPMMQKRLQHLPRRGAGLVQRVPDVPFMLHHQRWTPVDQHPPKLQRRYHILVWFANPGGVITVPKRALGA